MFFRALCLALTCVGPALLGATANPLPEQLLPGLDALLQRSLDQSPRMIIRALDLEMAEESRIAARSAILPQVSGTFSVVETRDRRRDLANTVDATKTYYNLTARQPLFHWGERRNTARIGEIGRQIAAQNFREAYRQLGREIRERYLSLITQKVALERAKRQHAALQEQSEFAEQQFAAASISRQQLTQAQLAAEQEQLVLDRLQFDYELAKQSLARLCGVAEIRDAEIPDAVPEPHYEAAAIQRRLGEFLGASAPSTPELANLRRQLEIEQLNYRNHRTRLRPKFDFTLGVTQDEQAYTLNVGQKYGVQSFFAGIAVNWTLFDGFAAQASARHSLVRRRQLELESAELQQRQQQQAQQLARQLAFAARSLAFAERFLRNSEELLAEVREEAKAGQRTKAEVNEHEIALLDAQMETFNARANLMLKTADFLGLLDADPLTEKIRVP